MTAFTIAIALIVATYHFVDHIAAIFTSDAETFWAIRMFIFYAVAFSFFDAAGTPVQGILRGYKDVKIITYVAFVTYWLISIPMGYAMAHVTSYGLWLLDQPHHQPGHQCQRPELAPVEAHGLESPCPILIY